MKEPSNQRSTEPQAPPALQRECLLVPARLCDRQALPVLLWRLNERDPLVFSSRIFPRPSRWPWSGWVVVALAASALVAQGC
jgi:hypothetical protein